MPTIDDPLIWHPDSSVPSDFHGFVPFYFWLIEKCRPETSVHLGLKTGLAFATACHASKKQETAQKCLGFSQSPLEIAEGFSVESGFENAQLSVASPKEALATISDQSVDLICMNLSDLSDIGSSLHREFSRVLSPRAVVVFYGNEQSFLNPEIAGMVASHPCLKLKQVTVLRAFAWGKEANSDFIALTRPKADLGREAMELIEGFNQPATEGLLGGVELPAFEIPVPRHDDAQTRNESKDLHMAHMAGRLRRQDQELRSVAQHATALTEERDRLLASQETRFKELVILTRLLEEMRLVQDDLEQAESDMATLKTKNEAAMAKVEQADLRINELLGFIADQENTITQLGMENDRLRMLADSSQRKVLQEPDE